MSSYERILGFWLPSACKERASIDEDALEGLYFAF